MFGRSVIGASVSRAHRLAAVVALYPLLRGQVGLPAHGELGHGALVRGYVEECEHPVERLLEALDELLVDDGQRLDTVFLEIVRPGRLLRGDLALEVVDGVEGELGLALTRGCLVAGARAVDAPCGGFWA